VPAIELSAFTFTAVICHEKKRESENMKLK